MRGFWTCIMFLCFGCYFAWRLRLALFSSFTHMERRWAVRFNLDVNSEYWSNIYNQKIILLCDKKIAEFNFKLLHNIVPCGYSVSKFNTEISPQCQSCGEVENVEHMLYGCHRIHSIWNKVAKCIKCKISWKKLCGMWFYCTIKIKICRCLADAV